MGRSLHSRVFSKLTSKRTLHKYTPLTKLDLLERMLHHMVDRYSVAFEISTAVGSLIAVAEIPNGFGRHIYIFGPVEGLEKTKSWMKGLFVFELVFHTATTLSKFAMYVLLAPSHLSRQDDQALTNTRLAFYYRILPIRAFRRTCVWVAVVSILYLISVNFTIVFQWYDKVFHGHSAS